MPKAFLRRIQALARLGGSRGRKCCSIGFNAPPSLVVFWLADVLNIASMPRLHRSSAKPLVVQPLVMAPIRGRTKQRMSIRFVENQLIE